MIYEHPWAYELACSFRDVGAEVEVLRRWSGDARNVLELAAGPAEHAREFARRGVAATALDLSPEMCAYAQERGSGLPLEVVEADMTDFRLGRRFDLVITMLDSTAHLMTLDAFVAYLACVAGHLADDGLAVIEMSHPADRLSETPRVSAAWTVEKDGVSARVRWGEPSDEMDPITQIVRDHVTIAIDGGDTIQGVVPYRFWTATELDAALRLAGGLTVEAQYGDFDPGVPLDSPEAWRMITLLRRSAGTGHSSG
ncbi:class I SAM-dependent methyltransferase [Actinoallomurus purpureus]|uniref:class I SAM-dependent methyltransferase n=1 Tax=Actinoallomurus purpureus TaxID=478114 RepID=UPI0020935B41|nr:class I SAM-dependent methyltransferase [Actinoallomurus purpureus]MCO6007927.1 class I SAM-dependent methyltransferase [Actinoallomurus purpureus]